MSESAFVYFIQEVADEIESALLEEVKNRRVSLFGGLILEKMCRQSK
jgi:hypothetical protein